MSALPGADHGGVDVVEHYNVARPGGRQRPAVWLAAAWLVRAEEGRSKESSGGDGALARVCHDERDIEERKREASE